MRKPILAISILFVLLTAACAASPSQPAVISPPPTGTVAGNTEEPLEVGITPQPDLGTIVVPPVPSTEPQVTPGGAMIPAVERVISNYASQNNLNVSEIKLVSTELVDWPDGCLGVVTPGIMCIEVITPGYRIILDVNGATVELHSTISGDYYVVASPGNFEGYPLK